MFFIFKRLNLLSSTTAPSIVAGSAALTNASSAEAELIFHVFARGMMGNPIELT
jgi:hypothetical protein